MSESSFQPFSLEHGITLLVGFLVISVLILFARLSEKTSRIVRSLLAFLTLSSYPLALFAWRNESSSLDNLLPFHLCDIAAFVAGFALLTRKPILLALTYFWGLAATTQALITPAISLGPHHLAYYHFFIQHFAIVAAALYIPLCMGWRIQRAWFRTALVVLLISITYQGLALGLNIILNTNFAFASRPPENPSVIDHLGKWPLYLFSLQGIALLFYVFLALFVRDKKAV